MNDTQSSTDNSDAPPKSRKRTAEPTTGQLIVPLIVTLFAIAALVMFVYGFFVVRSE